MDLVDFVAVGVVQGEGRDAVEALFLDCTDGLATGRHDGLLVAAVAALASHDAAPAGPFHREHLRLAVDFIDLHLPVVAGLAANAGQARRLLQRVRHLVVPVDEVLELRPRLAAAEQFCAPPPSSLTDVHERYRRNVGLERVGAGAAVAVHLLAGNGDVPTHDCLLSSF